MTRETWSTLRALGLTRECPGQLVEQAGPQSRDGVAQYICSAPWGLWHWPESSGTAGQTLRPSDLGPGGRDSLSTPQDLGPGPESPGTAGRHGVFWTQTQVAQDSWSNPRALRHGPESPGKMVDPVGPWTRARLARESWSNTWALGPKRVWLGRTGSGRSPWEPVGSRLGYLVDPTGPWAQARAARETCRPHGASGTGLIPMGQSVVPAGPPTQARVTRDRLSTPQDHGPGPETLGRAGRHRKTSDPGPSHPGQLEDTAGPLAWD